MHSLKQAGLNFFLILQLLNAPTCQKKKAKQQKPQTNRKPPASHGQALRNTQEGTAEGGYMTWQAARCTGGEGKPQNVCNGKAADISSLFLPIHITKNLPKEGAQR